MIEGITHMLVPPPSTTPCVPCVAENGNKNSFAVCALCFYWACIMLEPTSSTLYACTMDVHAMVPTAAPPPPLGPPGGGCTEVHGVVLPH